MNERCFKCNPVPDTERCRGYTMITESDGHMQTIFGARCDRPAAECDGFHTHQRNIWHGWKDETPEERRQGRAYLADRLGITERQLKRVAVENVRLREQIERLSKK